MKGKEERKRREREMEEEREKREKGGGRKERVVERGGRVATFTSCKKRSPGGILYAE